MMPTFHTHVTLNVKDKGIRIYDDFEEHEARNLGSLFRMFQAEYGRCTSKVYITTKTEEAVPVGWTFENRQQYQDTREWYVREAWVTLVEPPVPQPLRKWKRIDGKESV